MMNTKVGITSIIAIAVAFSANATDYYYVGTGTRGDTTNATKWEDVGGNNPAYAPGNASASADDRWIVRDGKSIKQVGTVGTSVTHFYGNGIVFGEINGTAGNYLCESQANTASAYFHCPAYFANGSFYAYNFNSIAKRGYMNGSVVVTAPESAPFYLKGYLGSSADTRAYFTINASISSERDCALAAAGTKWVDWTFNGDMSGYKGTLDFSNGYVALTFGANTGAMNMKNLIFGAGTSVKIRNTTPIRVGTLTIGNGDTFDFSISSGTCPSFSADAVSVSGTVVFNLSGETPFNGEAHRFALVSSASGGLSLANFTVNATGGFARNFAGLTIDTGVDGMSQTLYAVYDPSGMLVKSDSQNKDMGYSSAMGSGTSWSDGSTPHLGVHYLITNDSTRVTGRSSYISGGPKQVFLRTPETSGTNEFLGASLTLGNLCRIYLFGKAFKTSQLVLDSGSEVWCGQQQSTTVVADEIRTLGVGEIWFGSYASKSLTVDAPVTGVARLVLGGVTLTSSAAGNYDLGKGLTNFLGTVCVTQKNNTATYGSNAQTLMLKSGYSLGGALDVFRADALMLSAYSVVSASEDVELPAGLNRGLSVVGTGRISVGSGKTLTLGWPLTVDGTLYKSSAGTLMLGANRAGVGENGGAIVVTNGTLAVAAVDAVNGYSVSFAPGTSLSLKVNLADEELTRYGIRNVGLSEPFVLGAGMTALPLSVDTTGGGELPSKGGIVGVLTVSDSATNVLDSVVTVPKTYRGFKFTPVKIHDDENGWTTYAACYETSGFIISFR